MKYGFGVDIGGTTIKIGLFSIDGKLVDKWEIQTNKIDNGKYILQDIAHVIQNKIALQNLNKNEITHNNVHTDDGRFIIKYTCFFR